MKKMTDMQSLGFSTRIRLAASRLKVFTARELFEAIDARNILEERKASTYIQMYIRHGVIRRLELNGASKRAVNRNPSGQKYEYMNKTPRVTNRQRLWNIVRRMKNPVFTADDLEQLTDISRNTIKAFCLSLVRDGFAVRTGKGQLRRNGTFDVKAPVDKFSSERTRRYKKKAQS